MVPTLQKVTGWNDVVQELDDRRTVAVLRSSLQHTEPSTHNQIIIEAVRNVLRNVLRSLKWE